MDKYKGKYRQDSTRLQNWNYAWAATYFVTICTKNKRCYFGDIIERKMQLSTVGIIADVLWKEIPNHTANVELGEHVVMPDHIHGIIILNEQSPLETTSTLTELQPSELLDINDKIGRQRFQKLAKNSLSSIVGSYKSAVSKHARRLGFEFAWQSRYHDHIIRNEKSFYTISEYIILNPENWGEGKMSPEYPDSDI
jgi:putative transposase